MKRTRLLLAAPFVLVLTLAATSGAGLTRSTPTAIRVGQTARVLSPEHPSVMATLIGYMAVDQRAAADDLARRNLVDQAERAQKARLEAEAVEIQRVAEEARVAEEERVAEEARVAAKAKADASRTATTRTTVPSVAAAKPAPAAPVAGGGGNTSGVDINCESGGNYAINTGNGYYGAYQFLPSTFNTALGQALKQGRITQETYDQWYGVRPDRVPPWVQDAAAAAHVAAGNRGAWPNC